ncbi:regulatory protein RecX [Noviherbaspirillum soli]|uniref:regulatory protein RecX n=1 Tax=Noviherbaspirillum soli TaxID=1064518 RepID=UPI00188A7A40|nr:regulatory protein RecX [Noviherbaspirillum soli]
MYLINKKTGVPEPLPEDEAGDPPSGTGKPERPRRDASSFGRRKPEPIPGEYTRTSDRKRPVRGSASPSPGEYTRTSDRKRKPVTPREPGAPPEKPAQSAKAYAVWLLARQDYSATALRRKLGSKSYDETEVEDAMAFVIGNRYQDDGRFAEQRSRGIENRAGNRRIEMTLRQKGIDAGLAKSQVQQLAPEEERVLHAVAKFQAQVKRDGMSQELKLKIYRFLAYRGFSSKAIRAGIESLGTDGGWVDDVGESE